MSATAKLVEFAASTDFESIPQDVVEMAKRCMFDCVGVALAGSVHPLASMLRKYLDKADGVQEATILGSGAKVSASHAALANGTLAHVLDFDDTSYSTGGHPTAPIMAAILAVGEVNKLSGARVLEAFVLGFEAECKLGAAMNPTFFDMGWHPMGPLGRVGSVIAVSKLLGFDRETMENALSLACVTASGLGSVGGTSAKAMNSGLAAEAGVRSALFAKQGMTGPRGILEKKQGFCDVFSGKYDLSRLVENLGRPYDLISPGVAFKRYPSCTATHAAIDAVLSIRKEHLVNMEGIERIECRTGPWIPRLLTHPIPESGLEGKFSLPYCVSAALIRGPLSIDDFDDEAVKDPQVNSLMKKVIVEVDDELAREGYVEGATVTVKDKSGRQFEKRVDKAKGNPENPLSDDELRKKFTDCASRGLKPKTVERLADLLLSLEKVENVADLMKYAC